MSVKIRLARKGRKKIACYRIVAADSCSPRDGKFLETLGFYNPQSEPKDFKINIERIGYWLNNGAEPSTTVKNLLKQDCYEEKLEAVKKGLSADNIEVTRKPERKRKPKSKANNKKKS